MIIDFATTAMCRPDILRRTYESFQKNLIGVDMSRCSLSINIDPLPNADLAEGVVEVASEFFGTVFTRRPARASFPLAVRWCWGRPETEFFFHLEDDWVLEEKVHIDDLIKLIEGRSSVNLRAYEFDPSDERICLSPGLFRSKDAAEMASRMSSDANPEKQLRPVAWDNPKGGAHGEFKGIQTPGKPIVKDIGRKWLKESGFKKDNDQIAFMRWIKDTKKMIRVLWPTIRPAVAIAQANKWREAAGADSSSEYFQIQFGINDEAHRKPFEDAGESYAWYDVRPGVCATATRMSRAVSAMCEDSDIIVLASDDFTVPVGWSEYLREQYIGFDGALIVNDGYKIETDIIPLPILSGKLLKRMNGVIYNPVYHHVFSDNELYDIVSEMRLVRNRRDSEAPKFAHKHWIYGARKKDEFDRRYDTWWAEDEKLFRKRKAWPIEKKILLPEGF